MLAPSADPAVATNAFHQVGHACAKACSMSAALAESVGGSCTWAGASGHAIAGLEELDRAVLLQEGLPSHLVAELATRTALLWTRLGSSSPATVVPEPTSLRVVVTQDEVYVAGALVTEAELPAALVRHRADVDAALLVGGTGVTYERVTHILHLLREAGFFDIGFGTGDEPFEPVAE